jgi:replicative DNA helicase
VFSSERVAQLAPVSPAAPTAPPVPPQNLEAEESVLGAMMLSPGAIGAVSEILDAGDFYRESHARIYRAALALYAKGEPVDAITLVDELEERGELEHVGGRVRVHELAALVPATANAAHYARIVREMATLRGLIRAGSEIARIAAERDGETTDLVDRAEKIVFDLSQQRITGDFTRMEDLLKESFERITALYEAGAEVTGTPSGFRELDRITSGFQAGNLVIVAARPSMGKSAFALCVAANLAVREGIPVGLFTLEMSKSEVTQRLLCSEAKVDSQRLRSGKLGADDWPRLVAAGDRLAKAPMYVDDTGLVNMTEIRSKSRRLKSRHPDLGLIIVDYLQLMSGGAAIEHRVQEVSQISRQLKVLARDLEVPIVALSQLSRAVEQRSDKRPMLSDLRESGCMPASTRLLRSDGREVTLGELVLTQEQPLVWTLDENWRITERRLIRTFPSGVRPVFRLRLRSGYEVEATANHPFRTLEGWTRLDDLRPGAFIATPRRIPAPEHVMRWREDELVLLAHLLGDGSIGPNSVKYATADSANKSAVEEAALRLFGIEVEGARRGRTWQLWLPSPHRLTHGRRHPVREWLEPLGLWGSRSHTKFVPEPVFALPDQQVALFLRHLWATDGSITLSRNGRGELVRAYYATTSRQLADGVRRLLLRFGIRSAVARARKAGYRDSWHVRIQGREAQERFLTTVGCQGERGAAVAPALEIVAVTRENPNVDLVPWEVAARVKAAAVAAGVTHRELASALGERYSGSYLLRSSTRPRRFSRDRLRRIGEAVADETLVDLGTSDVLWDEVVAITPLGELPTFDATVEGTHNFIANGVFAHNSIEQDSDVVAFIYRDEYYNDESDQQGLAEVIVAKHRNGPTDSIKLSFLKRYAKFTDLAAV